MPSQVYYTLSAGGKVVIRHCARICMRKVSNIYKDVGTCSFLV